MARSKPQSETNDLFRLLVIGAALWIVFAPTQVPEPDLGPARMAVTPEVQP